MRGSIWQPPYPESCGKAGCARRETATCRPGLFDRRVAMVSLSRRTEGMMTKIALLLAALILLPSVMLPAAAARPEWAGVIRPGAHAHHHLPAPSRPQRQAAVPRLAGEGIPRQRTGDRAAPAMLVANNSYRLQPTAATGVDRCHQPEATYYAENYRGVAADRRRHRRYGAGACRAPLGVTGWSYRHADRPERGAQAIAGLIARRVLLRRRRVIYGYYGPTYYERPY